MEQLDFFLPRAKGGQDVSTSARDTPPGSSIPLGEPPLGAINQLFSGPEGNAIRYAFAAIDVAEDEIADAMKRHPERAAELNQSFRFLSPTAVFEKTEIELYRHHARELLERVADNHDVRPGTNAELLAAMVEISLAAPPSREFVLLYQNLFTKLFPAQAAEFFDGIAPDPYEAERIVELETELRRKLAAERDCHAT